MRKQLDHAVKTVQIVQFSDQFVIAANNCTNSSWIIWAVFLRNSKSEMQPIKEKNQR